MPCRYPQLFSSSPDSQQVLPSESSLLDSLSLFHISGGFVVNRILGDVLHCAAGYIMALVGEGGVGGEKGSV